MLFLTLFLLFCFLLLGNTLVGVNSCQNWLRRFSAPVLAAGGAFFLGTLLCKTPLVGIVWSIMGWLSPGWVGLVGNDIRKASLRGDAKNIVTAASGLYASGMVTPDVVKAVARNIPEPLAGDFQIMLGRHNTDQRASFPSMLEGLSLKYEMPEFKALASIIGASEHAGGPKAAADGLKQLAVSLRNRDRRLAERRKDTLQPLLAAGVTIALTVVGIILDITFLAHFFVSGAGKVVLAGVSLLTLLMVVIVFNALYPEGVAGGGGS